MLNNIKNNYYKRTDRKATFHSLKYQNSLYIIIMLNYLLRSEQGNLIKILLIQHNIFIALHERCLEYTY